MMEHQLMNHSHHGHNLQNHQSSVNWNYSPTAALSVPITSTPISNNTSANSNSSANNTWTPPRRTRGVKRAMSESDCDDIYSEESSKEHASSMENDSCQLQSRKKRRGVIEKKRRDRINLSLTELKRLVPTAFEKQGSAKLEKAEILQLTVDHLKALHSKGVDSIGFDPQRFAMDYHIIGFRECATEVARYLVTVEGMDIQDPLRLRLMSHLQCFAAQRELSAKSSTTSHSATPNWPTFQSGGYQPNYSASNYQSYPSTPVTPHQQQHQQQQNFNSSYLSSSSSYLSTPSNTSILSSTATSQSPEYSANYGSANTTSSSSSIPASANTSASKFDAVSPEVSTGATTAIVSVEDQQPIYTDLSNSNDRLLNYHYNNNAQIYGPNNNNGYNNNVKPYRPWHPSEMAY